MKAKKTKKAKALTAAERWPELWAACAPKRKKAKAKKGRNPRLRRT